GVKEQSVIGLPKTNAARKMNRFAPVFRIEHKPLPHTPVFNTFPAMLTELFQEFRCYRLHVESILSNKSHDRFWRDTYTNRDYIGEEEKGRRFCVTTTISALGGYGEIGKNMTVIAHGRDAIVLDAGMIFPGADEPGVACIVPDMRYVADL